jgi:type II secretory ATPase GspE/PulE/Tfp pilus assembly ATPase PilB-like protein
MFSALLSDASPVFLLSPWKPIFIVTTFIAWGWLVSTHLEKDARTARLNPTKWNCIHICAAFIALGVMLLGINFYFAFPIGFIVLLAPILVYWKIRNEAVIEERKFKIGSDTIKSALETRKRTKASRQVSMHFDGKNGSIQVPKKDDPQLEIYLIADELITDALLNRASRLEFRLTSTGCQSVYHTDGLPIKQEAISVDAGAKVIAFLKEAAGTDPSDVRRRQTGSFDAASDQARAHIDLTSFGSSNTHTVRLDFNRSQDVLRDWNMLGMLPKQRELLDQLTLEDKRHGILLIGGDKQSGLTTTGYAILRQHDSYLSNIVTIEQEIYASLEGITHSCVHDQEADYATQLQTLIRRDPEVILAADLIDAEAAKNATKPGKDGPLIIVGMKASSMPELISRWAGLVSDPRKSFDALQAIVYQKLVRKLCENCRVAYKPSQDLAKQGLPIDTVDQLYRKGGQVELKNKIVTCPICNGSGYFGQVGVFETMFLDNGTRKHLVAGDLKAAMAHAKRNKCYIRLQEAAWYKVAAGETSLEEFGRVNRKRTSKKKVTKAK